MGKSTTVVPTSSSSALDAKGHRERLRERLLGETRAKMADYELIEYLLALALPRIDTKPMAKELLRRFGSLSGVFAADADALMAVKGMGRTSAAAIRTVRLAAIWMLAEPVAQAPILSSWAALLDFLQADQGPMILEEVRVLHLNARNMLMRDEVMNRGTVSEAPIYVREVIRRALDIGSAAIILVHNHPSGDPRPSKQDIEITREIAQAGRLAGCAAARSPDHRSRSPRLLARRRPPLATAQKGGQLPRLDRAVLCDVRLRKGERQIVADGYLLPRVGEQLCHPLAELGR